MSKISIIFIFIFSFSKSIGQNDLVINITEQNNVNQLYKKDLLTKTLDSFFTVSRDYEKGIKYWEEKDLHFFGYPWDLANYGFNGDQQLLQPVFLGAIDIVPQKKYVIKIAYVPVDSTIKSIGRVINLIGNYYDSTDKFLFENYTNHFTRSWYKRKVGNIIYFKERERDFNIKEALASDEFNNKIAKIFKSKPKEIIYYSCSDPIQLFNLQGFDFRWEMFLSRTGGRANWGGLKPPLNHFIYSESDTEYYPHEIAHFYIGDLYTTNELCPIAMEGIATFFGGTEQRPLKEVLQSLKSYLSSHPDVSSEGLLFEDIRMDEDISRLYATGAVIAKAIYEKNGLDGWKKWLAIPCEKMVTDLPLLLKTDKTLKEFIKQELQK